MYFEYKLLSKVLLHKYENVNYFTKYMILKSNKFLKKMNVCLPKDFENYLCTYWK